jgi:arylsulfatase A-like enzyme
MISRRVAAIGWPLGVLALLAALLVTNPAGPAHGAPRVPAPAGSVPGRAAATATSAGTPPNIVFILTDDLTTNLLKYMPNVQRMERDGLSFSRYFVVDSLCCPSRAAILTGRYPHNDGVFSNQGPDGGYTAFDDYGDSSRTYGLGLQAAGYATGFFGKYLNGYDPTDGVPSGWDEWDVAGLGYREYNYDLNEDGSVRHYGSEPRDYLTSVLSRRASSFIARTAAQQQPFAVEIAPFSPHLPAIAAPRDVGDYRTLPAPRGPAWNRLPTHAPSWLAHFPALSKANKATIRRVYRHRVRAVLSIDRMVGHLRTLLDQLGIAQDTYVVFSSDNGYHLGQHRLRPGKQTAFDTDIRVPLVVTGPDVPPGRRLGAVAASIDLAPTFAAIANTQLPAPPDGTSMLPLWHGVVPADWPRAVLIEHRGRPLSPTDPDYQSYRAGSPPSYVAIRTAHALYVKYVNGDREYYDLRTDPYELHNQVGSVPAAVLGPLRRTLRRLSTCAGPRSCTAAARIG